MFFIFSFYAKTNKSKLWLHFEKEKFKSEKKLNQVKVDEEVAQDLVEILFKNGYKKPIEINDTDLAQNDDEADEQDSTQFFAGNSFNSLIFKSGFVFLLVILFYRFIFNYFDLKL